MKCTEFNEGWKVRHITDTDTIEPWKDVTLPYDAMLREPRGPQSMGQHNIGWFEGRDYEYQKTWHLEGKTEGASYILRFDGVYHNAQIFVNDKLCVQRPYGYIDIYVDMTPYIESGDNVIRVVAHNADQPNSRWYSGSGIYRPVYLFEGVGQYLIPDGIHISTTAIDPATFRLSLAGSVDGEADYVIKDADGKVILSGTAPVAGGTYWNRLLHAGSVGSAAEPVAENATRVLGTEDGGILLHAATAEGQEESKSGVLENAKANPEEIDLPYETLTIPDAHLWDADHPYLYTIQVTYGQDVVTQTFGIRLLSWDAENGLQINGQRLLLKGACIHSDTQLLGAETYPEAEERRVRLLKENGYNAIRSAHNPCCRYLLDACDRLGMYLMDEYADCWYIHKTKYDYASYLPHWYHRDLANIVAKDYSHPCVVLYSTGNEVSETAQERGIALTGKMTRYLHKLDPTRPVTCGVNIFFNLLSSLGFGVYSDDKAEREAAKAAARPSQQTATSAAGAQSATQKKKKAVGSEFYNQLAGLLGDKAMKMGATLHGCDVKTRDAYVRMDIAGYNYGILRYRHDLAEYPDRLILGSETFCKDAYQFMQLAKKSPRIVGDFVWAGQDYLGETGIGSWEYEDYAPKDGVSYGWLTAGGGRIDITGKPLGEAYYTRCALGTATGPFIAVSPVYQKGQHSPSSWKMSDAVRSWSWHGCDGYKANVEVYANAEEVDSVELFLNEKSFGRKKLHGDCVVRYQIDYHDGRIRALAYAKNSQILGTDAMITAGAETRLQLVPEKTVLEEDKPGEEKALYSVPGRTSSSDSHDADVTGASPAGEPGPRKQSITLPAVLSAGSDAGAHLQYVRLTYTDDRGIWKPMEKHRLKLSVTNGTLKAAGHACPFNPDGYLSDTVSTYYGEALAIVETTGEDCILTAEEI